MFNFCPNVLSLLVFAVDPGPPPAFFLIMVVFVALVSSVVFSVSLIKHER